MPTQFLLVGPKLELAAKVGQFVIAPTMAPEVKAHLPISVTLVF
jgi:hypothetical protein